MKQRCLYCYCELEESEKDFHVSCATDFFGDVAPFSYPIPASVEGQFNVKCASEGYDPVAEAVALKMARAALILTLPSTLIRSEEGRFALAQRSLQNPRTIESLISRFEDCSFDGSFEMIAEVVERFSSIARLDVVTLFEQIIFGWIVGCDNMDISSFALSEPHEGVMSLAPIATLRPLQKCEKMTLELNGKCRNITFEDFAAAMKFMGLKDRIIRITMEKMLNAKESWFKIIDDSPLLDDVKVYFKGQVESRLVKLNKSKK